MITYKLKSCDKAQSNTNNKLTVTNVEHILHVYIHTCMYAYIHSHIPMYVHTLYTYIHTCQTDRPDRQTDRQSVSQTDRQT